jgi:arginine-tRNA-protein transferase
MRAELEHKEFFLTSAHPCSYLEDREARTLFLDPREEVTPALYGVLTHAGFRRSGSHLYRPHCQGCSACVPVRVTVGDFRWSRRFRRIRDANADLKIKIREPAAAPRYFELYSKYIRARHAGGDMDPPTIDHFRSFLMCDWGRSQFLTLEHHGELVGVAVTDQVIDGFSAIYTFFDPEMPRRSLGVYAVLAQIEHCISHAVPYLYLGYWVRDCAKMRYKTDYRPLELLINNRWIALR